MYTLVTLEEDCCDLCSIFFSRCPNIDSPSRGDNTVNPPKIPEISKPVSRVFLDSKPGDQVYKIELQNLDAFAA